MQTGALPDRHRHSIRLPGFDYTQSGVYFVTLVAWRRECAFGDLPGEAIVLSQVGRIISAEWQRLPQRFPHLQLDEFVVMPNHVRGILIFADRPIEANGVGARRKQESRSGEALIASPRPSAAISTGAGDESRREIARGVVAGSPGAVIGAFKSTTTRLLNLISHTYGVSLWQRNYYEHVIRDEEDLARIRQYILDNPRRWLVDDEYQPAI